MKYLEFAVLGVAWAWLAVCVLAVVWVVVDVIVGYLDLGWDLTKRARRYLRRS